MAQNIGYGSVGMRLKIYGYLVKLEQIDTT